MIKMIDKKTLIFILTFCILFLFLIKDNLKFIKHISYECILPQPEVSNEENCKITNESIKVCELTPKDKIVIWWRGEKEKLTIKEKYAVLSGEYTLTIFDYILDPDRENRIVNFLKDKNCSIKTWWG